MKNINRIPKPIAALIVVSLVAAAVYASVSLGPFQVNLTVGEPLSVSPSSFDISLYAGESATKTFTITNAASVTINAGISATVSAFPQDGSADDVVLTYSSSVSAAPGDTTVDVQMAMNQGAVAGSYTVSITVTR